MRLDDSDCVRKAKFSMDLSECRFEQQIHVHLNGEWEMFWKKMKSDLTEDTRGVAMSVPRHWYGYPAKGFTTYRT